MNTALLAGFAAVLVGCASAGGFPSSTGDPNAAIATARRQIAVAHDAGADSLSPAALAQAEHELTVAEAQLGETHPDQAAVSAQQAAASAAYAKAQADKVRALHEESRADSALRALPRQPAGS